MIEDIKKVKELLYRLEDIIKLGTSLPLVAYTQLKKHAKVLHDAGTEHNDYFIIFTASSVEDFISKHSEDYNERDERAIIRGFQRLDRSCPDYLERYRQKAQWYDDFFNKTKVSSGE